MKTENELKIAFMGGKQAGIIGVLAAIATGNKIISAVSYSEDLTNLLKTMKIPTYKSIKDEPFIEIVRNSDVLLSVHGREIVRPSLLSLPKSGCINVHPYLYKYKGANPVGRALNDRNFKASVASHMMVQKVDEGEVLFEEFIDVGEASSEEEIYNRLYPYYAHVVIKTLKKVK